MRPNLLVFRDIMESDLIFYDADQEAKCREFCQLLRIGQLPCIDNPRAYYELIGDEFEGPKAIKPEHTVEVGQSIFDLNVLSKFRLKGHNVLFVQDHERLAGVVHISDYNKPVVLMNYYAFLLDFEQKLRDLLVLQGKVNEDMIDFYSSKSDDPHYFKQHQKYTRETNWIEPMQALSPFQVFPIQELLRFAWAEGIFFCKEEEINQLRKLRNSIMHGQDAVGREGNLFSYESLATHFERIGLFVYYYKRLHVLLHKATGHNTRVRNTARLQMLQDFEPKLLRGSELMWRYLGG
jgi:hypothetical protein